MPHLIFPASEVVRTLQQELVNYLDKYQNSLVQERVDALVTFFQTNRVLTAANSMDPRNRRWATNIRNKSPQEIRFMVLDGMCRHLVFCAATDALNTRLNWVPSGDASDKLGDALVQYFPAWEDPERMRQSSHVFINVIDPMYLRVQAWVDFAIKEKTWNTWYLRWFGDDILMQQGEDYRVLDWTRRMDSGEWKPLAYTPEPTEFELSNTQIVQEMEAERRPTTKTKRRVTGPIGVKSTADKKTSHG